MKKYVFVQEYEIPTRAKKLFRFLSTPEGLSKWFADQVQQVDKRTLKLFWNGQAQCVKISIPKPNVAINFEFVSDTSRKNQECTNISLSIQLSDFTNSCFLKVTDTSPESQKDSIAQIWQVSIDHLISALHAA